VALNDLHNLYEPNPQPCLNPTNDEWRDFRHPLGCKWLRNPANRIPRYDDTLFGPRIEPF